MTNHAATPPWRPRRWAAGLLAALLVPTVACGDGATTEETTVNDHEPTTTTATTDVRSDRIAARGTTFHVDQRGDGPPLLLIHGGGEDASMLAPQADALAGAGYRVITYDRRGTGRSGRDGWPGEGADQHADDAAALLDELAEAPATVLGVSSGGVVALALAARHPGAVERAVAWEPPAMGVVPGGGAITAEIMAPVEAHLAAHPGDFAGAQAILLTAIVGAPVDADDPAFAATRANAEPMVRDEPAVTLRPFAAEELSEVPITLAVGTRPNDAVAAASAALEPLLGSRATVVDADHEVYLTDPAVLAELVGHPG